MFVCYYCDSSFGWYLIFTKAQVKYFTCKARSISKRQSGVLFIHFIYYFYPDLFIILNFEPSARIIIITNRKKVYLFQEEPETNTKRNKFSIFQHCTDNQNIIHTLFYVLITHVLTLCINKNLCERKTLNGDGHNKSCYNIIIKEKT